MSWPWILIAIGALVVVTRAPLIFRPTLTLYRGLWATNGRVRALGGLYVALGLASILGAGQTTGVPSQLLLALAAVLLGIATWLLAAPAHFRSVADGVVQFVEGSVDTAAVRFLGVLAVAVGATLVWFGARAL